jgi:hypothetical protein
MCHDAVVARTRMVAICLFKSALWRVCRGVQECVQANIFVREVCTVGQAGESVGCCNCSSSVRLGAED